MSTTGILFPPKILREKLGEDGTEELVQLIGAAFDTATTEFVSEKMFEKRLAETERKILKEFADTRAEFVKEFGATRADFAKELGATRGDFAKELGAIRAEFAKEIGNARYELQKGHNQLESRLTWKLITMWSVQTALLLGILVRLYVR